MLACSLYGALAQLVEQLTLNQLVVGSIPTRPTNIRELSSSNSLLIGGLWRRCVADHQLIYHLSEPDELLRGQVRIEGTRQRLVGILRSGQATPRLHQRHSVSRKATPKISECFPALENSTSTPT